MKIALGTVQFGMDYGIANRKGQVSQREAAAILQQARSAGLDTLDTAISYGNSELVLGQIGVEGWRVITKLPALPQQQVDPVAWVEHEVQAAIERLGVAKLSGLLLHQSGQLLGAHGHEVYGTLQRLKQRQIIDKIGVSIYAPEELDSLLSGFEIDLVQAPFNIFDRRLTTTGWLDRLDSLGIEIHTRSVFLQGLLLMPINERPEKFAPWQDLWNRWHKWLAEHQITALQACLKFVLAHDRIGRVIVGVDSQSQLADIIKVVEGSLALPILEFSCEDINLINPSRWSLF